MAEGWKTAKLSEVPPAAELPSFSRGDYFAAMEQRAPHIQNQELYLVVEGRARFVCDGVGGRPGEAYTSPIWAWDYSG